VPFRLTLPLLAALLLPAPGAAQDPLSAAWRGADDAADAIVLIEYDLAREGRGFGSGSQRVEMSAVGVVAKPNGLVVLSDNIFPEDVNDSRTAAAPADFVVRFSDGTRVPAELAGRSEDLGLCYLRVTGEGPHPALEFVHGSELSRGAPLLVAALLPERYGFAPAFSRMSVAAVLHEPQLAYDLDGFVQDAGIGSPVLDSDGRAVGIVTVDRFENGGPSSTGPALPLSLISAVTRGKAAGYPLVIPAGAFLHQLDEPPSWKPEAPRKRAWLGVTLQEVDRKLADYLDIQGPSGILITSVWEDSPAERAGLRREDIITRLNGRPVVATDDEAIIAFIGRIQAEGVGAELALEILRGDRRRDLKVVLGEAPVSAVQAAEVRSSELGLVAQDLTMDIIQGRGWPTETRGALVSDLEMAGAAMVGGLQRGDLILAVDGQGVSGANDLSTALDAALAASRPEIVFFVLRDPDTLFIVLKPE
jgi:serine protease Do